EALAEMAVIAEARHYASFDAAILARRAEVLPVLRAELRPAGSHDWTGRTGYRAELLGGSAVARVPGASRVPLPDPLYEGQAKRQAHAAAALVKLGEAEAVWPLLKHSPDPSVRSYLVWRLAGVGLDPLTLIRRFDSEPDVSARRALLI